MKKNIRSKISSFLKSEEGRVSAKAPLALGIATGSVLLAQTMVSSPAQAAEEEWDFSNVTCIWNWECEDGEVCALWIIDHEPGPTHVVYTACIVPP
ncbi:MAG: hypothetical protein OXU51_13825 [Candidatus Poribacteria bacterium]|nr:hypothetical protein [Candidatus Poribacteria bacterium]